MADYCTNDDLVKWRPSILNVGVDSWTDQITEACAIIDRALESRWYRHQASERGVDFRDTLFSRALVLNSATQLKRVAIFKSLSLAYIYLAKDSKEPDAFERQAALFDEMYDTELREVLDVGIDYDWDASGAIGWTEKYSSGIRRLHRC